MVYEYDVALNDRISANAASAAVRVKALTSSLGALQSQLAKQVALGAATKDVAATVSKVEDLKAAIAGLPPLAPKLVPPGKPVVIPLTPLQKARAELLKTRTAAQAMSQAKNEVSSFGSSLSGLAGPAAIAASAIAAVGAAVGALLLKGSEMALDAATFQAASKAAFKDLTGSAKGAADVMKQLADVQNEVPQSEAEIAQQAKALLAEGLDPSRLRASIKAAASVAAVEGERGATAVQNIMTTSLAKGHFAVTSKQLKSAGLNQAELAKALGMTPAAFEQAVKHGQIGAEKGIDALNSILTKKYSGSLAAAMDDPKVMLVKFKDAVFDLFKDVKIAPFLDELRHVGEQFGKNTLAGQTLRGVVVGLFSKLFELGARALPIVEHALMQVLIAGVRFHTQLKPLIRDVDSLGQSLGLTQGDGMALVSTLGAIASAMTGGVVLGIRLVVFGLRGMVNEWNLLKQELNGAEVAAHFIHGLVDGIAGGVVHVVAAVKGLGASAVAAIKAILGISSPSKVMMAMGGFTATGFTKGIEAGNDNARAAGEGMARAATGGVSSTVTSTSNSRSITVHVEPGAIVIEGGGKDAEEIADAAASLMFERLALMMAG